MVIFRFRNTKIPIPARSDMKQNKFSIPRAMGICASRALIGAGARRKRNNEVNSDVWASALIVVLPPPSFCLFVETHIGFGFMGSLYAGSTKPVRVYVASNVLCSSSFTCSIASTGRAEVDSVI